MGKIILLTLFIVTNAWSAPRNLEVWFLSTNTRAQILDYLNHYNQRKNVLVAEGKLQCQQMGDYCFDPQVGLYKRGEKSKIEKVEVDYSSISGESDYESIQHSNGVERNMISCDKNSAFDIFCGKATQEASAKHKLEIWVDTSSTMKQVDFEGYDKSCSRAMFLKALSKECSFPKKMNVHIFNTTKKQTDTLSSSCMNYGLNETQRLMKSIKETKIMNLIVITDIFEASSEFVGFIESLGGKHKGVEKPLYAKDLNELIGSTAKLCL